MTISEHALLEAPGLITWKDTAGRILSCNQEFADLVGAKSPEAVTGKTFRDVFHPFLNSDIIATLEENDQRVVNLNRTISIEEINVNHQQQLVRYITKRKPVIDNNNNVVGIISSSIEISITKSAEQFIIQNCPGHLYWKDSQGRYLGCNQTFAEYLGITNPIDVIGRTDFDFQEPELAKAVYQNDQVTMNSRTENVIEESAVGSNGLQGYFVSRKIPIIDEDNTIRGLIGTSLDVTAQKRTQIAKQEFIANMSHDLRTPFTGILSIADMLLQSEDDVNKKTMLEHIAESSKVVLSLFNEMLEMSNSNSMPIQKEETDLKQIVNKVVALLQPAAITNHIQFNVTCDSRKIISDPYRIEKIFHNLVSNAVKFSSDCEINIEVTLKNELQIVIEDHGIGIEPQHLESIFDLFFKATPSREQETYQGSGMGLYLVKKFVEQLQGDIFVKSEKGVGTRFEIILPYLSCK